MAHGSPRGVVPRTVQARRAARRSPNTSRTTPTSACDIQELFPALVEIEQLKFADASDSIFLGSEGPKLSWLGDYQNLGIVGEGGMGIVYEAFGSRVAVEIMHQRFRKDASYLRRFDVEAARPRASTAPTSSVCSIMARPTASFTSLERTRFAGGSRNTKSWCLGWYNGSHHEGLHDFQLQPGFARRKNR